MMRAIPWFVVITAMAVLNAPAALASAQEQRAPAPASANTPTGTPASTPAPSRPAATETKAQTQPVTTNEPESSAEKVELPPVKPAAKQNFGPPVESVGGVNLPG